METAAELADVRAQYNTFARLHALDRFDGFRRALEQNLAATSSNQFLALHVGEVEYLQVAVGVHALPFVLIWAPHSVSPLMTLSLPAAAPDR